MPGKIRLFMSLVLAGLCACCCLAYGSQVRADAERVRGEALERYGGETVQLLIATRTIEAGEELHPEDVAVREWLTDFAPADAITSLAEIEGRQVQIAAAAGVPLTTLNFRETDAALEVPSGCVALTFALTDRLALPGTAHVGSMIAAYEVGTSGVKLVASGLQILRLPAEGAALQRGSITLAAQPRDVSHLLAAGAEGSLRFASPADDVLDLSGGLPVAPTEVSVSVPVAPAGSSQSAVTSAAPDPVVATNEGA